MGANKMINSNNKTVQWVQLYCTETNDLQQRPLQCAGFIIETKCHASVIPDLLEHPAASPTGWKVLDELTFLNWACSVGYSRMTGKVKSKVILKPSTISLQSSSLQRNAK